MLRPLLLTSSVLGISILTVFAGCSSSSTSAGSSDAAGGSDVIVKHDSSGSSSGSSSGGSGDDSGGDSGGTCSAGVAYTSLTWTNVVAHQGLCSAADLSAFLTACGDAATGTAGQATCTAWLGANVAGQEADGGGAGTACGNCILPPNKAGTGGASFLFFDSMGNGYFGPNYPGCIQIRDTTNGPACAGAYNNLYECVDLQCSLCTGTNGDGTSQDPAACEQGDVATGGICASYLSPYQTSCMGDNADGGIADQCSPGAATQKQNPDWTLIINLICGGGDGGTQPTDAGDGG
jgi:hypothetical protein